jgi:hypothetical protein
MTTSTSQSIAITALLIDPNHAEARRVSLIVHDDALQLDELYALLGCDLVECAPLDDRHLIWANEEGWDQATGFTVIDDGANAIAGRFLIIGETDHGELQDVALEVAPLLARLTCHRCLFEPEFATRTSDTGAGFCVETRLQGVTPWIDRTRPRLVD